MLANFASNRELAANKIGELEHVLRVSLPSSKCVGKSLDGVP